MANDNSIEMVARARLVEYQRSFCLLWYKTYCICSVVPNSLLLRMVVVAVVVAVHCMLCSCLMTLFAVANIYTLAASVRE